MQSCCNSTTQIIKNLLAALLDTGCTRKGRKVKCLCHNLAVGTYQSHEFQHQIVECQVISRCTCKFHKFPLSMRCLSRDHSINRIMQGCIQGSCCILKLHGQKILPVGNNLGELEYNKWRNSAYLACITCSCCRISSSCCAICCHFC